MKCQQLSALCVITAITTLAGCSAERTTPTSPSGVEHGTQGSAFGVPASGGGARALTIASEPAPSRPASNFEIDFMTGMIDHHHMAIMMAETCLARATHTELRSLCENIRTAQMAEIELMQEWLQDWYGLSYEPTMKPGDEKMMDRLASLTGAEFEITFMEMMIKHHEMAIKEGRHCLDRAYHAELRELCENIISTQSNEIGQMRTWLCQWYDGCR